MEDTNVAGLIDDEIRALIRLAGVLDAVGLLWDETTRQPHIADTCGQGDPSNWKTWPSDQREQIQHMFGNGTVPGPVVTASIANRGLRVKMTFQDVRVNRLTECEGKRDLHDDTPSCTEGDPCGACKFLDGTMCKCRHPYTVHSSQSRETAGRLTYWCAACDACDGFSLASWTDEPLEPERDLELEEIYRRKAESEAYVSEALKLGALTADWSDQSEGDHTQSNITLTSDESAVLEALGNVAIAAYDEGLELGQRHKEEPTMTDTKKPRINRATWHETDEGKDAILRVTGALTSEPVKSWYAREVANEISVGASDVSLALEHLISTGAITKHGRAKGTRYAVAGFTDWPAPLPRGKKQDDQFAEEEPFPIIGSNGAT